MDDRDNPDNPSLVPDLDDELDAEPDTTDFDAEQDKRADQPGGALSPGTTATGSPTGRA
ncbi:MULTISPECIES: hypothetical protein [unclassified Salinibacterium]|uniref:hypothetical protein n=1 Tax=unclassified Salinibacterium TaxID=2632331 RepID=UPI00141F12C6|nr:MULTISPECIES: hypothetical protein [unclassified Salinibacterium]